MIYYFLWLSLLFPWKRLLMTRRDSYLVIMTIVDSFWNILILIDKLNILLFDGMKGCALMGSVSEKFDGVSGRNPRI